MAREGGLGKSLHEVLDSLKPAESWPDASRVAREQLEQELNELIEEVQALRAQVQQLTADAAAGRKSRDDVKHKVKKKHKGKKKQHKG
jgi:chromosome segregation ATPase